MKTYRICLATPDGSFEAAFTERGLCQLTFPGGSPPSASVSAEADLPARIRAWARATAQALRTALAGRRPRAWPPLDLAAGTEFQQAVWQELRQIPWGETRTYGAISTALGRPGSARAVGQACGANPVPVFVPCHRVLAAQGRLGGFSGGLHWKKLLLEREVR